jgi:hypothetical protein
MKKMSRAFSFAVLAAQCVSACAQSAPQNLAPNSQWEIWSGVSYGTAENSLGTGTVAQIVASSNSTGTAGATTFTVRSTGELKVGDLATVSGAGIDPSLALSPMRVTSLTRNSSITVRLPFGLTPTISHSSTITPIVIGNLSAKGTGDAADGWKKTPSMPIWRENNSANVPAAAYYSIGMTKDVAAAEQLYTIQDARLFGGSTVSFGILGYQKVRGGSGTWQIYFNDSVNGVRVCNPVAVSASFQWAECSVSIPAAATYFYAGVQLVGARSDTYYFANPVLAKGGSIGGAQYYTKPREKLFPLVHISPIPWINATITFPAVAQNGQHAFVVDPYAETGGQIAPTVAHAKGQLEGINNGTVRTGTGDVRVMAWYDRLNAPERSGSFLPQYVQNVKSFAYMDCPLNSYDTGLDMLGTAVLVSRVASDRWSNVSLEFDEFDLQ